MLKDMVRWSRVEVLLIQESKLAMVNNLAVKEFSCFARTRWVYVPLVGATGGVIIFWDKEHIVEVSLRVDKFLATLTATKRGETEQWRVTVVLLRVVCFMNFWRS